MKQKELNKIPKIKTSFGEIAYIDINSEKKNTILFITGGGVNLDSVYSFKWLTESNYRIIAINRPGYNNLKLAEDFKVHADIYNDVLNELNIIEPMVFGVSMGAVSALTYSKYYKAKALLLWSGVSTSYIPNQDAMNSPIGKLILGDGFKDIIGYSLIKSIKFMPKTTLQEFIKASAKLNKSEIKYIVNEVINNKKEKEEVIQFVKSMTPMSYIYEGMMKEVEMTKDFDDNWSSINIPTLAIHSEVDADVDISNLKHLEKSISNIKMIKVRAAGHYIWWGKESEKVKDISLNFIKEQFEK